MHIELYASDSPGQRQSFDLADQSAEPILYVDKETIEERTSHGGGPTLMRVEVIAEDGKLGRFWIAARINKEGVPVLTVSTERDEGLIRRDLLTHWQG